MLIHQCHEIGILRHDEHVGVVRGTEDHSDTGGPRVGQDSQ